MRPATPVLDRAEYEVRPTDRASAIALVTQYHYAKGGPNTGVAFDGLYLRGSHRILGVAWWLPPTKVAAQTVHEDWRRVLCLTRLVVLDEVPQNGASFLLAASIRRLRKGGYWKALVTYADEGQGHTGAIYRATNWVYRGTRPGDPVWLDRAGRQVSRKSGPRSRTSAEMLALGYVNTGRTRKHKFTMDLG